MQQFDIACVVFEGDVRLLELQLISIDRLFDLSTLGTYWLIVNGQSDALEAQVRAFIYGLSPTLRGKIVIVPAPDIGGKLTGWRGQQVLKLMISRRIETETYLVLDAKNHFIKPAAAGDFFAEGKALTYREPASPLMQRLLVPSLAYFDVGGDEAMAQAMPTITPYPMYTSLVRGLIDEVEGREGKDFSSAFLQNLKEVGEFFLYYGYLRWRGEVDARYVHRPKSCVTLFATWPEEPALIDRVLGFVTQPEVLMFGLHRLRLPKLSPEHSQRIARMWQEAGLATAEEATYYLTPPPSS